MIKIGVVGLGHIGKIHVEQLLKIKNAHIVGVYDIDHNKLNSVSNELNLNPFENYKVLLDSCDAVLIASDSESHFELCKMAIKAGKHVFVEKPLASTLEEALTLVSMSNEANIKCMVGHVERFNPALLLIKNEINNPLFIEAHRLATFSPRISKENVILDLMIHDIDIVLNLVKSEINRISATGVKVISDNVDIANARIEFSNGCIANLTASRISQNSMRKMRVFQKEAYFNIDFLNKTAEHVSLQQTQTHANSKIMHIEMPQGASKILEVITLENEKSDSIQNELNSFIDSILQNRMPLIVPEIAYKSMDVAYKIIKKINSLED